MNLKYEQEGHQSFYHLEICCRHVAQKLGNEEVTLWTNSDYVKLSHLLGRHTEVLISASTLKRIFGKLKTNERYFPQKATRNALARYGGFESWDDLVAKHPLPVKRQAPQPPLTASPAIQVTSAPVTRPLHHSRRKWMIPAGVIAVLVIMTAVFYGRWSGKSIVGASPARLICNNPEGNSPHSAVFSIKLPEGFEGDKDAFAIYFGDDKRRKKIKPDEVISNYYEIPGRYYAVLYYKRQPVDTVAVYLQTEGWSATGRLPSDTTRVYPVLADHFVAKGSLTVSARELHHAGVDTNHTFFVHFVNAKPLEMNGDNFEMQADVKTSQLRPGVRCSQVDITVWGQEARHRFSIAKPGCATWMDVGFSEVIHIGNSYDLNTLAHDLTGGGIITLTVKQRNVRIMVNNKPVYETSYQHPLGALYGVEVMFAGIGELRSLTMKDLRNDKVLSLLP